MSKAAVLALGLGIGAILVLEDTPKPRPVTRTVIVHQVTTHVVRQVGTKVVRAGLPAWAIVVIAIVALGTLCGLAWRRTGS